MGHASLVADEPGQMHRLGGVVLGEGLNLATMTRSTLLGVESHGAMARRRELAMRLRVEKGETSQRKNILLEVRLL